MILQCDQCKTRFRLDDSKLKPGGVKVRCSKCRHVFIAGADLAQEESDFDAILSGLGAPVPEPPQPAEAALPETAQTAASLFEEPKSVPARPRLAEEAAAGVAGEREADSFAPEEPPRQDLYREEPDGSSFDFGDLSFGETTAPESLNAQGTSAGPQEFSFEPAAPAPAKEGVPAGDAEDGFGELSFEEPAAKGAAPAALASDLGFQEFSFEEQSSPRKETPAPAPTEAVLDFGEFSFDDEPVTAKDSAAPPPPGGIDFGEVSFSEEPAPVGEKAPAPQETAFDLGEFSFDEEPSASKEAEKPTPTAGGMDFGEFSFEEEPKPPKKKETAAAEAAMDFGAISFDEKPAASTPAPFDEISFEEPGLEPAPSAPPGAGPAPAPEPLDFSAFSFEEEPKEEAAATPAAAEPVAEVPAAAEQPAPEKLDDFAMDFGPSLFAEPSAAAVEKAAEPIAEEETPPPAPSSRRKARSLVTVSLVTISVIMVLALSTAGFYLMQKGPAAFDKLGLGFIAKWFGMESVEEGRITVRNPIASFHQNKEAGELFVVSGQAVNSYKKARASIHVKVTLYDKKGGVLLQKTAYCGNKLTDDQLANLPVAKIDAIMNNQFGDSLANLGVQPGKSIPFVVAIANVPKEAADFGVEVVGSTVAGP